MISSFGSDGGCESLSAIGANSTLSGSVASSGFSASFGVSFDSLSSSGSGMSSSPSSSSTTCASAESGLADGVVSSVEGVSDYDTLSCYDEEDRRGTYRLGGLLILSLIFLGILVLLLKRVCQRQDSEIGRRQHRVVSSLLRKLNH